MDAPSGTSRLAIVVDTPRFLVASSRVTGIAAAVLVVDTAIDTPPNVPFRYRTGPISATKYTSGSVTTVRKITSPTKTKIMKTPSDCTRFQPRSAVTGAARPNTPIGAV